MPFVTEPSVSPWASFVKVLNRTLLAKLNCRNLLIDGMDRRSLALLACQKNKIRLWCGLQVGWDYLAGVCASRTTSGPFAFKGKTNDSPCSSRSGFTVGESWVWNAFFSFYKMSIFSLLIATWFYEKIRKRSINDDFGECFSLKFLSFRWKSEAPVRAAKSRKSVSSSMALL